MSLHEGLKNALRDNTGTGAFLAGPEPDEVRVFPLVIPQKVPRGRRQVPAVVYTQTNWQGQVMYCGMDDLVLTTLRLDCYAATYDGAYNLGRAVRSLLLDYSSHSMGPLGGECFVKNVSLDTEFDVQDFEPGLFRKSQSWNFWHVEN